jgi:putative flippase GtrA
MRHQFAKYFIVGFSGLFLDMGSLYLLTELAHLRPVVGVMINGVFMLNYIFFLNKHWTFKSSGVTHKQIVRFLILGGFNYAIAIGWMYLFNDKLGLNHFLARISNIAVAVAWNFFIYKYWVYKQDEVPVVLPPSSG